MVGIGGAYGLPEPPLPLDSAGLRDSVSLAVAGQAEPVIIFPAKPFRQKGKKYMSKRSGQAGQVFLRNNRWVGRFYVDVPGQDSRVRKATVLGLKGELTKPQARRKLKDLLAGEGVNTPEHLERSQRPPTTFNDVVDLWESKRLPQLKESSRYSFPKLIAKHLRPFFGPVPFETTSKRVP